ncbi:MAG: WbqC family protein [Candidatus Scalinduaceae bacterium]
MILTTHQPIFLPWPGFFFKAIKSDCMVLLDNVQFPRGRGWVNRNRLKTKQGPFSLTVPVCKKSRGLQIIRQVEIFNEIDWRKKHFRSIKHNYANASYSGEYFPIIESIFRKNQILLVELNIDLIRFFWDALSIKTRLLLQSELGVNGNGTELLINICRQVKADAYLTFSIVEKHLDLDKFNRNNIQIKFTGFHPPIYPQLWGKFFYNLSTLDMLLNCGPKCIEIISNA